MQFLLALGMSRRFKISDGLGPLESSTVRQIQSQCQLRHGRLVFSDSEKCSVPPPKPNLNGKVPGATPASPSMDFRTLDNGLEWLGMLGFVKCEALALPACARHKKQGEERSTFAHNSLIVVAGSNS